VNIIIDPAQIDDYREKYTVLELDTIRIIPGNKQVTAYCVVESIPILELPLTESKINLHHNLLKEYRNRNWNFCQQALEHLMGSWNKELDTFYDDVRTRITVFIADEPPADWDGIIEKHTA
jgi:hypothetical protein